MHSARHVLAALAILASALSLSARAGAGSFLEVFGASSSGGFGPRLFGELQRQQARYPRQMAGAQPPSGIPVWRSIGPTAAIHALHGGTLQMMDTGRLRTILPHPTDPDTVYVLSAGGGVWKTTTFTRANPTWVPKTDDVFTSSGGALAFGRDPSTLYLGLGDPFGDSSPAAGGAMLRSTDGGDSWTAAPFLALPGATVVTDVQVDTSQAQNIVLAGTDAGLFRSTDGGLTYSQAPGIPGAAGDYVWSLARTGAGWLAAGEVNYRGRAAGRPATGTLYLSTDHGATWRPIASAGGGYSNAGRTTLGVGAPGDAVVYAFAAAGGQAGDGDQGDLFRSTDGGRTWRPLHLDRKIPTNPNTDQPNMDLMTKQAWYNQMILVDPSDAARNTVYLGGQLSSARTTDGGRTWTLLTNWVAQFGLPYAHADFHAAAFSRLSGAPTLFFGNDGGLFISRDGGASWSSQKNQGLVDTLHHSLVGSPVQPANVITGFQDDGTAVRQGSTGIFNENFGGDGYGTAWSQANGAIAMGSLSGEGVFRTTSDPRDLQRRWRYSYRGIDRSDGSFLTALASPAPAADPTGRVFYTTTGHHIYRTADGGSSWAPILSLPQSGGIAIRSVLNPLGVSPLDTGHIAATASAGRLLITADGGASWRQPNLTAQVPGWPGYNSTVAWANDSVLYAGNDPTSSRRVVVAKSTDGGATWRAATAGLPDVPLRQLLVSPADPTGNTVYAATYLGVYRTTDGGQSWRLFGAGLPAAEVVGLYMPPDGSVLRIATHGRGIWEITP